MIKRISANNDYRDIVRSCPSGVIDDIYEVEYYVDGYSSVYSASFSKKGSLLEVIIPSSALQTLPSGLLMRRAKYRNEDPSFPDGNYDLEFVEDMNVWLESGSGEPGPGPVPGEYLTADDLKTINNESLVGEGNIQINPGVPAQTFTDHVIWNAQEFAALDNRVTALEQGGGGGGVSQEQFNAHVAQNDAQFSSVDAHLQSVDDRSQATDAHLQSVDDRLTALEKNPGGVSREQFDAHVAQNDESFNVLKGVTEDNSQRISALENAGFATQQDLVAVGQHIDDVGKHIDDVDNKADDIQNQVDGIDQRVTDLENAGFQDQIDGLDQRVTDLEQGGGGGGSSWGSITGDIQDQSDLMNEFDADRSRLNDLENGTVVPQGIATESWVQNQNYASDTDLDALDARVSVLEHGGSPVTLVWGGISGTITDQTDLVNYVDQAIEDAISGLDVPLPENVVEYEDTTSGWMSVLSGYDDCDILKRPVDDEYTGGGVHEANTKNLVIGYHRTYDENSTEQDITLIEVGRNDNGNMTLYKHVITAGYEGDNNGESFIDYVTSDALSDYVSRSYLSNTLSGYATESWVENSATIAASNVTCNISGDVFDFENVDAGLTALVSRVEDQMDNITSLDNRVTDIENAGYATQTWIGQQGYITSSALSGYATRTWATNQFLEESKVWSGTEAQWNQLTAEEKASYTIALITQ